MENEKEQELFRDEIEKPEQEQGKVETKPEQSSSENHKFAELRRAKEKEEKAYTQGQIDALKINSFTGDEIKDELDLELYNLMKEAEKEGKDAVKEGYKKYLAKERESKAKLKESEARENMIKSQVENLKKAIPNDVERANLLKDENFKEIYEDYLNKGGDLVKAAKGSLKMKESINKSIRDEINLENEALKQSANPSSQDGNSKPQKKSFDEMTDEEIHREFNKRFGISE